MELGRTAAATGSAFALAIGVHAATHNVSVAAEREPAVAASRHPVPRFDDLDGGSPIIRVYPGVTESAADKEHNGTYNTGDRLNPICRTVGRLVVSHPEDGERKRQSRRWVRINGTPGETQYAPVTYTNYSLNPRSLLFKLKQCKK